MSSIRDDIPYLPTGDPDTTNEATLYAAGELGHRFPWRRKVYQRVKLDSGVVAANPAGVVAAGDAAFWKNKATFLVTNDSRMVVGFRNKVAGVFRTAATAGRYVDVLQRGRGISLADGGNIFANGEPVIAENDTAAAFDRVAIGAAPTTQQVGIALGVASGGFVSADVDIVDIE